MRRLLLLGTLLSLLTACSSDGDPAGGPDPGASSTSSSTPSSTAVDTESDGPSPDPTSPVAGDHRLGLDLIEGAAPFEYLVHAPPAVVEGRPLPLVLVFHGSPGNPEDMVRMTRFDALADEEDFLVVYPDSYTQVDHVATLLDHLEDHWPIDPRRIYATGFSRGAVTTYLLADELSPRIAAFAPVSASQVGVRPARPASLITFQGELDQLASTFPRGNRSWAQAVDCQAPEVAEVRLGGHTAHRSTARCGGGSEHVVYRVERMGHVWPRQATRLIWEFFVAHPLGARDS